MMKRDIYLHILTGCVVVPLLVMLYWLAWPYDIFHEETRPQVHTPKVRAGDSLMISRHYCISSDTPSTAARQIVGDNGVKVILPAIHQFSQAGCHHRTFVIGIPKDTPPGAYRYEVTLTWEVNPMRIIRTRLTDASFEVIQ